MNYNKIGMRLHHNDKISKDQTEVTWYEYVVVVFVAATQYKMQWM